MYSHITFKYKSTVKIDKNLNNVIFLILLNWGCLAFYTYIFPMFEFQFILFINKSSRIIQYSLKCMYLSIKNNCVHCAKLVNNVQTYWEFDVFDMTKLRRRLAILLIYSPHCVDLILLSSSSIFSSCDCKSPFPTKSHCFWKLGIILRV